MGPDISGLRFDSGDGTADATMTFSGSLSAVNAALDGLTYEAVDDSAGVVTLRIQSNDLGGAGAGGPLDSESLLTISVVGVPLPDLGDAGGWLDSNRRDSESSRRVVQSGTPHCRTQRK